ncbi:MAG: hypothetical protein JSU94_12030 [Phycisphaerales bacterium]|nr:MAG: hypothetical protein JSU94_12030 [Phycisphaerales bacterium]
MLQRTISTANRITGSSTVLQSATFRPVGLYSVALLSISFLAGCMFDETGCTSQDHYYLNPYKNLSNIGSVALLEPNNNSVYPQMSAELTESLFQAVQKRQLFAVRVVRQNDLAWRDLQIAPDSAYTLRQLHAMRQTLNCNAVLVGKITSYQPYPHMSIGLRLRLVDLADGQLLWAMEQIWDTADKATEKRIGRYFHDQIRSGHAPVPEQLVAVSPIHFMKFVAYEVAETLRRGQ